MKQNIVKSLNFSLILLVAFSCKKDKGVLDDFPRGKFNFVYILNNNSNQDTITGELSGPYLYTPDYIFIVRQELSMDKSLKSFAVGSYKRINGSRFAAQVNTGSIITHEEHDSDNLLIQFASGDTLSGSLSLTRKE